MAKVMERVKRVAAARASSPTRSVRDLANQPTLFTQDRQPTSNYLAIPEVSSANRRFIPIAFLTSKTIASNKLQIISDGSFYHFGILSSTMHNAWMRTVSGRMKSDYSYSPAVYNNYPWPDLSKPPTSPEENCVVSLIREGKQHYYVIDNSYDETISSSIPESERKGEFKILSFKCFQIQRNISSAAQAVLDARAQFADASLADLYDPLTMPPALLKAHQKLDASYQPSGGKKSYASDAERVVFLLELYQRITSLLPAPAAKKTRKTKATES
jgi:hypothetical protein